jgi:hypothetical protein
MACSAFQAVYFLRQFLLSFIVPISRRNVFHFIYAKNLFIRLKMARNYWVLGF